METTVTTNHMGSSNGVKKSAGSYNLRNKHPRKGQKLKSKEQNEIVFTTQSVRGDKHHRPEDRQHEKMPNSEKRCRRKHYPLTELSRQITHPHTDRKE